MELDNLLLAIDPANIVFVTVPLSPVPISVPVAIGKVNVDELLAECGCACNVWACALLTSQ